MDWILEKPLVIVILGIAITAILGGIWLRSGRKELLYGLLGAVLLTGILLVVERNVQTDREQIDTILHRVARLVERNEIEAAMEYVHSQAKPIAMRARAEVEHWGIRQISIKRNLEITVDTSDSPARAVATFNVLVVLSDEGGTIPEGRVLRFVTVEFEKENGQWRVADYEHSAPQFGGTPLPSK